MLAALKGCYDRLAEDSDSGIAPYGYSPEKISFALILSKEGEVLAFQDLRSESGKKLVPRLLAVPKDPRVTRTSAITANFLWDKTAYSLGVTQEPRERTQREHECFKALHFELLSGVEDAGFLALLAFLAAWEANAIDRFPERDDVVDNNIVFRIEGERRFLHETPAAREVWTRSLASPAAVAGRCLVTGEEGPIARLHPMIRGIYGAQSSGAAIVSADKDGTAFHSYGRMQGLASPVSEEAAFAYTTALNHLLRPGSRNRIQIADTSTVFWAESSAPVEEALVWSFFEPPIDDDAQADKTKTREARLDVGKVAEIRSILNQIAKGRPLRDAAPELRDEIRFFLLGLAPNAARIAVRFWHEDTLGHLAERFGQHYRDLAIEPAPWRSTLPAVWRLIAQTVRDAKLEEEAARRGAAHVSAETMRAILTGGRYPHSLLAAVVIRMRSDRDREDPQTGRIVFRAVNGMRAAICKACIVRDLRIRNLEPEEGYLVSLDKSDLNPGYRLGRLFAVLEAAQVAALGNVNASIRDRYYGAAAATPTSVFPLLMKNYKNHLKNVRSKKGERLGNWYEKRVGEIVDGLTGVFPRSLSLEDQGRFAIGYYHEREGVYRKKDPDAPAELADADQSDTPEDEE